MATHAPKLVPFNVFPWNNFVTQWRTFQPLQQTATYHLPPTISENSHIFSPARPNTAKQIQFNLGPIQPIYPGKKFKFCTKTKNISK